MVLIQSMSLPEIFTILSRNCLIYSLTKIDFRVTEIPFEEAAVGQLEAYRRKFDLSHFKVNMQINQDHISCLNIPRFESLSISYSVIWSILKNKADLKSGWILQLKFASTLTVRIESNGIRIIEKIKIALFGLFVRAT